MARLMAWVWRLGLLLVLFAIQRPVVAVQAQGDVPTPYELIDKVNEYRTSQGLPAYAANASLMNAADNHSEYQALLGTWTHTGPGGSDETDRAVAAGYGEGGTVVCDEAVAYANRSTTLDTVVYSMWSDYAHRELVLLNSRYVHAGAGVVEKDDLIYYTLDVCVVSGSAPPVSVSSQTAPASAATSQATHTPAGQPASGLQVPLVTVTPHEDGSVVHVVQAGQTMWDIAINYDMKVVDLATMNGISPSNPVVYIGQEIVVRLPFTVTPTGTITATSPPPTNTRRPTRTLIPAGTDQLAAQGQSPTPTERPLLPETPALRSLDRRTIGIIIVVICGLGLVIVVGLIGPRSPGNNHE